MIDPRSTAPARGGRRARAGVAGASERRRLRIALVIFLTVIAVGWIGYQLLADLPPFDAFYMTVITITTVGFQEIGELDTASRAFTAALIVAGVSTASYGAVTAAEYLIDGHFRRETQRRRMERNIHKLQGHVIVCGYGRVGRHLAVDLASEGVPFVVVELDEDTIEEIIDQGYLHVEGDASEEHILEAAGLDRARALVACVDSDADNVLVTLTSKGLRPDLTVVARTNADENEAKLRRAGADRVIAPTTIGARRISQLLTRPAVADFLDGTARGASDLVLEEVPIAAGSPFDGVTLRDAGIRERYNCTVLAVRPAGVRQLDTHPEPEVVLGVGDTLVVLGAQPDTDALRAGSPR